jgi:hypothetical protein
MNKKFKVLALSAIIALGLALPLAAQAVNITNPVGTVLQGVADPISNQRNATATLYKTDVDNYLNVNNWSGVEFEKWFGFLHGSGITLPGIRANLGYATKVGGLYIAARYWGNVFQQTTGAESVTLAPTYDPVTHALTQLVETTAYPADKYRNSNNHLDVLIGVAGQGIRLGFFEAMAFNAADGLSTRSFIKTDSQNGQIRYQNEVDEYTQYSGNLRPSLQWGTLLNVSNLTIKPRAGAAFNIYMNKQFDSFYADYYTFEGRIVGTKVLSHGAGNSSGYLQPIFTVGADIGLPKKDTLATTFTIDYLMNFNIYNNDYSASGFDGTTKGPVSWTVYTPTITTSLNAQTTNVTSTLTFNDSKGMYHRIAPKVTLDKAVTDGLKVGLIVQVPVTITTTSSDQYREQKTFNEIIDYTATNTAEAVTTTNTTVHTPDGLTETTVFTVNPELRVGASYAFIPGRFTVNAGVKLDPTVLTHTKTTQSRNGDGVRTTTTITDGNGVVTSKTDSTPDLGTGVAYNDVSTVNSVWSALACSVGGGFLFSFNENVALDLWANSGNFGSETGWSVNAASVNVMLTFKF